MKNACLFTISAPSGAGKTSLVKALTERKQSSIGVSISHTTREIRSGEADGVDYHFVSEDEFQQMIADDQFLEHASVFDHSYGTARTSVEAMLNNDRHVILEIDWQGARQVKQKKPDTVCIYILPPSREVLEQRLIDRATDDRKTIESRMMQADREMSHYGDAEFVVVNEDFERALHDLESLIQAQCLTLGRQKVKYKQLFDSIPDEID
jgi:guanylate kinase